MRGKRFGGDFQSRSLESCEWSSVAHFNVPMRSRRSVRNMDDYPSSPSSHTDQDSDDQQLDTKFGVQKRNMNNLLKVIDLPDIPSSSSDDDETNLSPQMPLASNLQKSKTLQRLQSISPSSPAMKPQIPLAPNQHKKDVDADDFSDVSSQHERVEKSAVATSFSSFAYIIQGGRGRGGEDGDRGGQPKAKSNNPTLDSGELASS